MAGATKICKVCGKEYEYCRTYLPTAFRWQDVACCREHAMEYFAKIEEARSAEEVSNEPVNEEDVVIDYEDALLDDEDDEEDEENEDWYLDDEDEEEE